MAVPEQVPYKEFLANGITVAFPLGFYCSNRNHLVVTIGDQSVAGSDWELEGDTVLFNKAPPDGVTVKILRSSPVERTTNFKTLHHKLFRTHAIQGISVSGDDVAQVQRSLASMQLRYQHQSESALTLMKWLKQQTEFVQVLHPADPDCAGHQYWNEICSEGHSAGLVSVIFDAKFSFEDIRHFCDALTLFKLGFSWGGPVSLVMLYNLKDMRVLKHSHLKHGFLVRFCIGLEHPQDLIQDIQYALEHMKKPKNE